MMYEVYTHYQDENPELHKQCADLRSALREAKEKSKNPICYGTLHVYQSNRLIATYCGGHCRTVPPGLTEDETLGVLTT
jgi:hypothetical protein